MKLPISKKNKKKVIVVSGANLFSGGTLSIIQDCLKYANEKLHEQYLIIALVYNKNDFKDYNNIDFLEFPQIRKNYLIRLYYEYFYFRKLSSKLAPYLWLSMNDTSSSVHSERRAVYCHNPTPFKKVVLSDLFNQPSVFFFTLFYRYLYQINIRKNYFVIVQQDWIRQRFSKMFKLDLEKIIVSHPVIPIDFYLESSSLNYTRDRITKFCYVTFPRPFKNIEIICEAVEILSARGINDFSVVITIDGTENRYSSNLVKRFGYLSQIEFIGLISRSNVFKIYSASDCLIFPSTLETWGLPISEFKLFKKAILLSDLEYAHETLGDYNYGVFFDPKDPNDLADKMIKIISQSIKFIPHNLKKTKEPFVNNWDELFSYLLK